MIVVVSGAAGLIGSRLVSMLASRHDVCAIVRPLTPTATGSEVRWISADLTDSSMTADLPPRADVVVHLAQSGAFRQFPERALDVFEVNVGSTARLLDWSVTAGVRHFVLASSGGLSAPGADRSYYLATKRSAELLVESYATRFDVLVVRFFFVYGHGQKPGMLVPRLIDTIRAGKEVPLAGDHGPRLNPTHVSDAARAVTAAIERRTTGRIDIAGPDTLTVREMSEAIGQHLGISPRFACDAAQRPIDLLGDTTMMRQKLVAPRCAFDEGIAEVFGAGARSAR